MALLRRLMKTSRPLLKSGMINLLGNFNNGGCRGGGFHTSPPHHGTSWSSIMETTEFLRGVLGSNGNYCVFAARVER